MLTCSSLRASYIGSNHENNACACNNCVRACEHKPGRFLPDEIESLAAEMGLLAQELFNKYLAVDCFTTDGGDVLVLSPNVVLKGNGEDFPLSLRGVCVFLKNNLCTIHNLGKPFECAAANCKIPIPEGLYPDFVEVWNTTRAQQMVWSLIQGRHAEPA